MAVLLVVEPIFEADFVDCSYGFRPGRGAQVSKMLDSGESRQEVIRPDFNRAIMLDFQGAKITSNIGFLLVREIDERIWIIDPMQDCLEDLRSPTHTKHSLVQMVRQRVYQIAAGYEDCNDADYLRSHHLS
jgi:hypothetical protein